MQSKRKPGDPPIEQAVDELAVDDGKGMTAFKMIWWPFYTLFRYVSVAFTAILAARRVTLTVCALGRYTIPDIHKCPKYFVFTFLISIIYLGGISYAGFQITDDLAHNVSFMQETAALPWSHSLLMCNILSLLLALRFADILQPRSCG